jgi:hypothetical protein
LLAACNPSPAPPENSGLQAITLVPARPTTTPAPTHTPEHVLVTATPDLHTCTNDEIAAILRAMPEYVPGEGSFITVEGSGFVLNGEPFIPRGVNYYPAHAPWQRFPTTDLATIEADFAQLQTAQTNTIRLFLWYPPLFTVLAAEPCPIPKRSSGWMR